MKSRRAWRQLQWLLLMAGATTPRELRRQRARERSTMCRPPRRAEAR